MTEDLWLVSDEELAREVRQTQMLLDQNIAEQDKPRHLDGWGKLDINWREKNEARFDSLYAHLEECRQEIARREEVSK